MREANKSQHKHKVLLEAPDICGGILIEAESTEELKAKIAAINKQREREGKPHAVVFPYTVISL